MKHNHTLLYIILLATQFNLVYALHGLANQSKQSKKDSVANAKQMKMDAKKAMKDRIANVKKAKKNLKQGMVSSSTIMAIDTVSSNAKRDSAHVDKSESKRLHYSQLKGKTVIKQDNVNAKKSNIKDTLLAYKEKKKKTRISYKEINQKKYALLAMSNKEEFFDDNSALITLIGQVQLSRLSKFLVKHPNMKLCVELVAEKNYKNAIKAKILKEREDNLKTALLAFGFGKLNMNRLLIYTKINQNMPFTRSGSKVQFQIKYLE